MDGPGGDYAYGNVSDREQQIVYVIPYMWILKNKMHK